MPLMPPMSQNPNSNAPPYSRTLTAKKASIKQKLELAVANGEMPPFCSNCGAIETSTWRKAWSQEHKGEPGYYEYSDEPGRVTAVIVLTRDEQGKPTSYQLIKKFLLPEESQDDFKEFLLCNRKFSEVRDTAGTNQKQLVVFGCRSTRLNGLRQDGNLRLRKELEMPRKRDRLSAFQSRRIHKTKIS
jgi:hypothetical protein